MTSNNNPESPNADADFPFINTTLVAQAPPPTSTPTSDTCSTRLNLGECDWDDVYEDKDGNATGILGVEWEDFSVKQLRAACVKLHVKGFRNLKKNDIVATILKSYRNKKAYNNLHSKKSNKNPATDENKKPAAVEQLESKFSVLFS